MFGRLQRYELYYVVGSVWIFQIIFSHIWLRYFRFGPFEWGMAEPDVLEETADEQTGADTCPSNKVVVI